MRNGLIRLQLMVNLMSLVTTRRKVMQIAGTCVFSLCASVFAIGSAYAVDFPKSGTDPS